MKVIKKSAQKISENENYQSEFKLYGIWREKFKRLTNEK